MLALLDASRQDIPVYAAYLGEIERVAARLGSDVDLHIEDDFPASVAAYKQFDVLFVNSVIDGLNLVAKEAPLVNTRDGVVVLSENTGAHEELAPWTLTVDPFDVDGQAEALYAALTQPVDERRSEPRGDPRRTCASTTWTSGSTAQLADLDGVG